MAALTRLPFGTANEGGAPNVVFGIHEGLFKDEGLDLYIHRVFGGPEAARELNENRVQIAEFGAPPVLTALSKGGNFKIIASGTRRKFMLRLGVRSDIHDFSELKGARVGVLSRGSCDEWIAREMWARNGLDPERDISFVPMGDKHPHMLAEMRARRIEAILGSEPNLSWGEADGVLRMWASAYDVIPHYQWGVMVARPDFIEERPELVRAVLRGAVRATHYGAAHPDRWNAVYAEHHHIPLAVAEAATARDFPLYEKNAQLDLEGLAEAIKLQQKLGAITTEMTVEDVVDLRFQDDLKVAAE